MEMRKENTDSAKMAKRIREEYNYMDTLPLEGWMWEFVRRSPRFWSAFETIKTVTAKYKVLPEPWPDEFQGAHDYISSIVFVGPFADRGRSTIPGYHILSRENSPARVRKLPSYWHIRYPDPKVRYCDFDVPDTHSKPLIWGACPFVIKEYSTLEENIFQTLPAFKEGVKATSREKPIDELDQIATWVRMMSIEQLKVGKPENTICIGISKKAKVKDIEEGLLPIIKQYLEPVQQKIRSDKWKHYIAAYDLKATASLKYESKKMTYKEIADLFYMAYPRKHSEYDAKDIERYHSEATMLIEKDKYKEYLPF